MTNDPHFHSPESARKAARAALSPRQGNTARLSTASSWDYFTLFMRRFLPACALLLGLVTISWPFLNDNEISFTLSKDDVAASDGKIRMLGLHYVGTDAKDRLFQIDAVSGLQDDPGTPRISLETIKAEMILEPQVKAYLAARSGLYRMEEETILLVGGVSLDTENGFSLKFSSAEIDLKHQTAKSETAVEGQAPLGLLKAENFSLNITEREGQFGGGVQLHITPKRPKAAQAPKNTARAQKTTQGGHPS